MHNDVLNKVQYRRITSVSVSITAETENVVSAAVSVTAVITLNTRFV